MAVICCVLLSAPFFVPAGYSVTVFANTYNINYIEHAHAKNEIIVRFHPREMFPGREREYDATIARLIRSGIHPELEADNTFVIREDMTRNPRAVLRRWQNNPFVDFAEPNYIMQCFARLVPNDPLYNNIRFDGRHAAEMIRAPEGWAIVNGGGPVIAVIDSGIAPHSDLPNLLPGFAASSGQTPNSDPSRPDTPNGHGTPVAGVIGAVGNNGIGTAGINWDAQLMPVKVDNAAGVILVSYVADGIRWAANNGARILNLSLGTATNTLAIRNAVNHAFNMGAIIVAATGNGGQTSSTAVSFPAALPNVIGVGGTQNGTHRVEWSSYGTGINVVAPSFWHTTTNTGGYATVHGTSISTPIVSGIVSLIWEIFPAATQTQIFDLIQNNTRQLMGGFNLQTGHGLVDMEATLLAARGLAQGLPTGTGTIEMTGWVFGQASQGPVVTSSTNDILSAQVIFKGRNDTIYSPSNMPPIFAGDYTVTVTLRTSMTHSGFSLSADFTIAPASLTIQIHPLTKVFSRPDVPTTTITGNRFHGEEPTLIFMCATTNRDFDPWFDVGTHTITARNTNPNYDVTFVYTQNNVTITQENALVLMNPTIITHGNHRESLNNWQLSDGWEWLDPYFVPSAGEHTRKIILRITDNLKHNYDISEIMQYIDTDDYGNMTITRTISFTVESERDTTMFIIILAIFGVLIVSAAVALSLRKD